MYYLLIFIILLLYYLLSTKPVKIRAKKENLYSFIICVILVLLAAFRSDEVGADTEGYRRAYERMNEYNSIQELIDANTIYYLGYFIPSKFFHMIGMPVQVWFGFIEALYVYAMMKLINKFSRDKIFSLLVFTTIGLYSFSFAGLKQTLASALMILAFIEFIEKKYWLSVLLIFLVYYTHQTALILLGAFPMYFFRNTKWLVTISLVTCVWIYFNGFYLMTQMVNVLENEKWETYLVNESGYTYVTFIFYAIITLLASLVVKYYNNSEPDNARFFLAASIIGCGLQLLAGISPSLFRLAYLFTPFLLILLPNSAFYSKNNEIVKTILIVSIVFYFLYTNRHWPYSFM